MRPFLVCRQGYSVRIAQLLICVIWLRDPLVRVFFETLLLGIGICRHERLFSEEPAFQTGDRILIQDTFLSEYISPII